MDKDNVMLHACFQLLSDCIEKEKLFDGHTSWDHDNLHIKTKEEILELYDWWKTRKEEELKERLDPIWTEQQHSKDTEMLIRLVKVRGFLWT